jgi:hypothetical protein
VIFLKCTLFQTTNDEVAVVPSVTQDVTELSAGESNSEMDPTKTGGEKSGGVDSNNHLNSNPDSDGEDEDGEPPDGTTREWHTARSGHKARPCNTVPKSVRKQLIPPSLRNTIILFCWMKMNMKTACNEMQAGHQDQRQGYVD